MRRVRIDRLARTSVSALAVTMGVTAPVSVEAATFSICIGEYARNCPSSYHVWYGCGTSVARIAPSICTVHTSSGRRVLPHQWMRVLSRGGNRCGYEMYQVQCGN